MQPAIRVENLCKVYRVNKAAADRDLRETLVSMASAPFRRLRHGATHSLETDEFQALHDVSFEVPEGEILGIIGRNGAGKSTLLKILSRITEPTSGRIEMRGRVGSLLEVGTGFHPDLSGRENMYLNGAILGMSRREINRKFDEIVDFAGVEQFIDTPVKRYSSGMRVRLGFAVAAHLEPEILIVDEVLAVGDAEFQKRCLGKMKDVAGSGRTVLFVSHNLIAVESLCHKACLINAGRIAMHGPSHEIVESYQQDFSRAINTDDWKAAFEPARYIRNAEILDRFGNPTASLPLGSDFHLRIRIMPERPVRVPRIGVGIDRLGGHRVLTVHTPATSAPVGPFIEDCSVHCRIPRLPLVPGAYNIKIVLSDHDRELEVLEPILPFSVTDGQISGEGRGFHAGVCVASSTWQQTESSDTPDWLTRLTAEPS